MVIVLAVLAFVGLFFIIGTSSSSQNNTKPTTQSKPKTTTPVISEKSTKKTNYSEAKSISTENCKIKGNINKSGVKIYHLPGQKYYDSTKIDTNYGERWFCTEEEAVAAGWRKSEV